MSSQIHNGHNITLDSNWGTLVVYQKCSCCFSLSKELTFALTWTHASAVTNRVTEKRISLIRHGFDWGLRLEAPCCCHQGSGSVTAVQCFGCDSYTGKINTSFSKCLGHPGKGFLSVLVKTEVVYSFTILFEFCFLKIVPNFCCIVYFNATLTNVPLILDYVMPFSNQVELLTLFKQ